MRYFLPISIIVVAALGLNGCATILAGTTQRVTIDSAPQGAEIIIDGRSYGVTPTRVRLDRDINAFVDGGKDIQLELDGYYADGYYLGTDVEPVTILNVFCLPGFAIDAVTGAMMRFNSDYYNFKMIPYSAEDQTVSNYPNTDPQQPAAANEPDDYEKLMKLVELYEEGLITQEEFEKEKAKIFGEGH